MIEVIAAICGASISVAALGAMGFTRRNDEARDAVIRLSTSIQHISTQLEVLHDDLKDERKEFFSRLSGVEQRVSKPEDLKKFNSEGYAFTANLSTDDKLVFRRAGSITGWCLLNEQPCVKRIACVREHLFLNHFWW